MDFDFDRDSRWPKIRKYLIKVLIWVGEIGAAILLAYFFVHFCIQRIGVVGNSMNPTLKAGDSIVVNKAIYRITEPKRFDVIVFKQKGQEHNYYNIRRIVGLPGETIQIKDGHVYINDNLLEESIEVEDIVNPGLAKNPYVLEDNEYFVLGDNRNDSVDSRFASIGTIVKDEIIGKAWIRLNNFSFVSSLNIKGVTSVSPEASMDAKPTSSTESTDK